MSSLCHDVTGMKVKYIVYIILCPKRFIPASDRNKHIDDQTNFVCALITPQTNVIVSIYILPYIYGVGGISIKFICFVMDVDSVVGTLFTNMYNIINYAQPLHLN